MKNKEQVLQRMKENIQLRGLSESTKTSYMLRARLFLEHYNHSVEQINEHNIHKFLFNLIKEK